MPKIIVYVRSADAKRIEDVEGKEAAEWVRQLVAHAIERWKEKQDR